MNISRISRLQSAIANPILIKKKENLLYLTGRCFDYRAEEYLLVKPRRINTDAKRRNTDVVGFGSGLEHIDWIKKSDSLKNLGKYLKPKSQLDIEYGFSYGEGKYLRFKLKDLRCKIKPMRSAVDVMRQVKDADETKLVRKSMQIVEKVFGQVKNQLGKKSWTEIGLAKFITLAGYKLGAKDISFPAIVASGANAAIPHHVPSPKPLKTGESIIIDFGFKYKNYCSDFTRTVFLKKVPKKLEIAYNQVEKAYNESMDLVSLRGAPSASEGRRGNLLALNRLLRPYALPRNDKDITAGDVYQKSVDILSEKHLEKYFIHSLGHGTGLEIHELPNLSPKSKDILQNGMVFSIEPGVYFPKLGGIRIEDLVYLDKGKIKKFIDVSTKLKDNIL